MGIGNGEFSGDVTLACLGDWLLLELDVLRAVADDALTSIQLLLLDDTENDAHAVCTMQHPELLLSGVLHLRLFVAPGKLLVATQGGR